MTERIPIVLASDDNYAPFVATVAYSILDNTQSFVEFYVLDGGITDKSKDKIRNSLEKFRNFSMDFIDMSRFNLERFPNMRHYTVNMFSRYFIPELLPEKKKVLYLDVDIIAKGDISELYEQELGEYCLGAILEDFYKDNYQRLKNEIYPEYKGGSNYFNSGVLLMDIQKLLDGKYVEMLVDTTLKYADLLSCPDQDVFNIVFENNFKILDYRFNIQIDHIGLLERLSLESAMQAKTNPVLIHYTSKKPWKSNPNEYPEFWEIVKKTHFCRRIKRMLPESRYSRIVGYYLFGFIPMLEVLNKENKRVYKIFGIPFIKSKTSSSHKFNCFGG